jgi:hypothetical protein
MKMLFRFECVKNDGSEYNVLHDTEFPTNLKVVHEFEMDDATRWDNIMMQFAKFLDAVGYVGVYEKTAQRCDAEWEALTGGIDNEDIGHPGLSD